MAKKINVTGALTLFEGIQRDTIFWKSNLAHFSPSLLLRSLSFGTPKEIILNEKKTIHKKKFFIVLPVALLAGTDKRIREDFPLKAE